jgi:Orsellinic acid/F9775 biosynthesis cluster protein D
MMSQDDAEISSYLIYVPEFEALICRGCEHGLTRECMTRHFQRLHKSVSTSVRKRLNDFMSGLRVSSAEDIKLPLMEIEAMDGLEVINGFECQYCGGLYGTLRSMQNHCRDRHEWVKSRGMELRLNCTD